MLNYKLDPWKPPAPAEKKLSLGFSTRTCIGRKNLSPHSIACDVYHAPKQNNEKNNTSLLINILYLHLNYGCLWIPGVIVTNNNHLQQITKLFIHTCKLHEIRSWKIFWLFFYNLRKLTSRIFFSIISYMFNLLEIFFFWDVLHVHQNKKLLNIEHLQLKQMFILYFIENDTNPHRGHYLRLLLCHSPW